MTPASDAVLKVCTPRPPASLPAPGGLQHRVGLRSPHPFRRQQAAAADARRQRPGDHRSGCLQAHLRHRHRQSCRAHARNAARPHEAPQGPARHLLLQPVAAASATGASATSKAATPCPTKTPLPPPAPRWPAAQSPQRYPGLLPHLRRRLGDVRPAARSADHPRRHHRLPPAAARLRRAHQRNQHAAQAFFRGQGRTPGHGRAGGRQGQPAAARRSAALARRALFRPHFARSLHRGRSARTAGQYHLAERLPPSVRAFFEREDLPESPGNKTWRPPFLPKPAQNAWSSLRRRAA